MNSVKVGFFNAANAQWVKVFWPEILNPRSRRLFGIGHAQ
jgi:hypothetical protein